MRKRRPYDGFNLAFLDVMACGLGAIILILMLVKFNASTDVPKEETERLQQELTALLQQAQTLEDEDKRADKDIRQQQIIAQLQSKKINTLNQQESISQKTLNQQQAVLADIEKSVAAAAPLQADDNIQLQGTGEENYLLGLKVAGKHIAILIDSSASMTDEKLIDVIKRKVSSNAEKKRGPKWQRTLRVVKWLLARTPQQSTLTLISFNNKAQIIGPQATLSPANASDMRQTIQTINTLTPNNGTNLQAALETLKKAKPNVTDIYLITDGLPTLGQQDKSLRSLTQCRSLFGGSKTITGECRLRLFIHTLQQANLPGVTVNTILLPLEGDPEAPQAYWEWAVATGGLMISPADSWP